MSNFSAGQPYLYLLKLIRVGECTAKYTFFCSRLNGQAEETHSGHPTGKHHGDPGGIVSMGYYFILQYILSDDNYYSATRNADENA